MNEWTNEAQTDRASAAHTQQRLDKVTTTEIQLLNASIHPLSVPFESLGAVSYSPSIATVAVSAAVCEIFNVKDIDVTLKTRLGVVQGHWKLRRSIDHMRLSIGRPL